MAGKNIRIKILSNGGEIAESTLKVVRSEAARIGITISDRNYDLVMAIGGDGVLIKAAKMGKPVMAVKAGRRNYHLDIPPEKVGMALEMLAKKEYNESIYPMFEVKYGSFHTIAFNEAGIISREPQTIMFDILYLDRKIEVEGDGAMVATPQGSTGWSFSASGSYLDPRSNSRVITILDPVLCPLKSIIIPETGVVFKLKDKGYHVGANLFVDGGFVAKIDEGEMVTVTRSKKDAVIYRFFEMDSIGPLTACRKS